MNWLGWGVWGFAATLALTFVMAAAQAFRFTRMSLPRLLGTMSTPNRDRAEILGILIHLGNGWIFSLIYAGAFQALGHATWWFGACMGLVHGVFVLMVMMPALPGMHPRMASLSRGPEARRLLEPPGFMALNYGIPTPVVLLTAHLAYGSLFGALYRIS